MSPGMRAYLDKCTAAPVDQKILDDLRESMRKAIPEIEKAMRRNAIAVAKLRREGKPLFA